MLSSEMGADTEEISSIQVKGGLNFSTTDRSENVTGTDGYEREDDLAVIFLCVIASLVIILNAVVLVASKFVTGGKTSTLVYIRSLCIADALAGAFGVIKTMLFYLKPQWVNCFLGESLLFSSICSNSLTLVLISIDLHVQLANPNAYFKSIEKKWVVFTLVFLWNISLTIGFIPQMGWVNEDFVCEFFRFHSPHHLILVAALLFLCITLLLGLHIKIYWMIYSIRSHNRITPDQSDVFGSVSVLVSLVRINMAGLVVFYLPLVFFTLLYCRICPYYGHENLQVTLHILMCWLLVKSLMMAPLYGAKNSQIANIFSRYCHCCGHNQETVTIANGVNETTNSSQADLLDSSTSSQLPARARNTNSSNSSTVDSVSGHYGCRNCGHVNPGFEYSPDRAEAVNKTPWFTKSSRGRLNPVFPIEETVEPNNVELRL